MTADAIARRWQAYLDTLPPDAPHRQAHYVAEAFGDNPALADELGAFIRQGIKTATCPAPWEWEAEGRPIPRPGLITIVLDSLHVRCVKARGLCAERSRRAPFLTQNVLEWA